MQVQKANEKTLVQFEEAVDKRDFPTAEKHLQEILLHLNVNHSFSKTRQDGINILPFTNNTSDEDKQAYYQLVTHKITQLFMDDDYQMSDFGFQVLNIFKSHLMWVYIASGRPNLDFILYEKGIADPNQSSNLNLQTEQDLKLLMSCYTIESDITIDFEMLYTHYPMLASYSYAGCFYYSNIVLTEKSENCLRSLIPFCQIMEKLPMDNTLLILCSNIWMTCTYMNATEKHDIKKAINKYYKQYLANTLLKKTKQKIKKHLFNYTKKTSKKKKLLIAAEVLSPGHAMLRCYLDPLISLSEKFETILLVSKDQYDKSIKQHFSKVIEVDDKVFGHHDKIVNQILNESPDIIYYPSLGMACWTLPLCNLRLAPIQIMSLGHPASSMSKSVDYYFVDEDSKNFVTETVEKPYVIPNGNIYVKREFDLSEITKQQISNDEIHIAVNCKDFKIRSVFIQLCKQLNDASSKKCVFHFFPNAKGLMRDCFDNLIKNLLPNYQVHRVADYQQYMSELAQCDISLSTFPFGGSNSNIDAFLLGLPRVILIGEGPEASADLTQARLVNLPDWLITDTVEQYFLAALALIEDDNLREEVAATIEQSQPEKIFFEDKTQDRQNIYPNAFLELYKQHRYDKKKKYNRGICY